MSQNLERLKKLLAEMFQLDQAELDFGIYRIMNAKRAEITRFLDNDLLPQVREAFQAYEAENRGAVEAELAEAIDKAKELGADPESLPRVKELRAKLAQAVDVTALENEVYSHLYNFFRRYYQEGDFISLRRYKEGVYAIPYEGEEVKLYWANHDQYYIKTSEYLRNYTFKLPSGKRVHFKLVEADTEKDNNRAASGNERRFILSLEQPLAEENGELVIRFEYRPDPEKRKQADLNAEAAARIQSLITDSPSLQVAWSPLLEKRPTEKNPNRTLLEKHLTDYTARNTFDYFIHKDLGGFLRRELDFYIKNEVMHLDDIESETAPRVEQYLSKIKAIRRIAHKIIDFLAQIENFQKKLWLKKKFVVETQYCITLDRIFAIEDEKTRDWLIDQIVKNETQREEWVRLFAIDEIKGDLTTPGYTKPLGVEFLKAHPTLVVDTRHFDEAFTLRLLASFEDLDEQCDGLLVHSENFQALNLLLERYREQVKCIYIDPPYNTGTDEFIYKDRYQRSSWLSMVEGRLCIARCMLQEDGFLFSSVDDCEASRLRLIADTVFGAERFVAQIVWKSRVSEDTRARTGLSTDHEYILCYTPSGVLRGVRKDTTKFSNPDDDPRGPWRSADLTGLATKEARPNLHYDLIDPSTGVNYGCPPKGWRYDRATMQQKIAEGRILFPPNGKGRPRHKLFFNEMRSQFKNMSSVITDVSTAEGTRELNNIFWNGVYAFPKPCRLIALLTEQVLSEGEVVLDFFAGSGTTAHAVINLNREDGGRRKFILVEMGDYFDTVLVPRLKKVIFTPEWKDGKPKRMPTQEEVERSPRILKILRLESYEDTLNNLEIKRTEAQQTLLDQYAGFREDYMLRYMLDVETRGSASLLNIDRFEDPFSYKLDIATGTAGETKPTVVDLVETFNYLIGLRVKTIDHIGGVRVVTGTNPQGERVLILWRNTREMDNDALDAWFRKQGYNTQDQEYDVIYVNGDNNLENLRREDETWKVRLIEEEFKRLMFDVQDV